MEDLKAYPIEWHFIGPIQSNKCKAIAENFHWVQSLDRLKIAEKLTNYCPKGKILNICVQVNVDMEENKSGILIEDLPNFCDSLGAFTQLKLRGLMAIPKASESFDKQRESFAKLASSFKELKASYPDVDTLSMGMSNDYQIALNEGSTMIRIGTSLFGSRQK